jgi:hypothetical protein
VIANSPAFLFGAKGLSVTDSRLAENLSPGRMTVLDEAEPLSGFVEPCWRPSKANGLGCDGLFAMTIADVVGHDKEGMQLGMTMGAIQAMLQFAFRRRLERAQAHPPRHRQTRPDGRAGQR